MCIAALMAAGITSCSDDDEPVVKNPDMPTVSRGAYVLTQGNWTTKVEGSLNVLDYATGVYSRNVFQSVNKRSLGATPQWSGVWFKDLYRYAGIEDDRDNRQDHIQEHKTDKASESGSGHTAKLNGDEGRESLYLHV